MKRLVFRGMLLLCLLTMRLLTFAQVPEIGEPCPGFVLDNVQQYSKKTVTLQSQQGRHFILDFFSSGCTSCVEAFPKTNKLYAAFKNQLDIILIGKEDKYIRPMYEKYRKVQQLQLPITFDSALCNRWVQYGYPHLIWIDDKGIVKAVTTSAQLTEKNVRSFIAGNSFDFLDRSSKGSDERGKDPGTAIQSFKTADANVLSASILSRWDGKSDQRAPNVFYENEQQFESRGMLLQWLYNLAYWGNASWGPRDSLYETVAKYPLLELEDTSAFAFDFDTQKGLYNYCQVVPAGKSAIQYRQQLLRNDLEKTFGYKVDIEVRKVPVWKLVAAEGAYELLKSKGGKMYLESAIPHIDFRAGNIQVSDLISLIWGYHQNEPLFINATGFEGRIDIRLNCIITDLEEVRKALQINKLDLVKGEKEIKVLVVRDAK